MRVKIHGSCESAKVLRTYLRKDDTVAVTEEFGNYNIYLEQDDSLDTVLVDGIDCDLERKMISNIEERGVPDFILARKGGVRSDRAVKLAFPAKYKREVEKGAFRGLHQELGTKKKVEPPQLTPPTRKQRIADIARSLFFPFLTVTLIALLIARNGHSAELPKYFIQPLPKQTLFQLTNYPIIRVYGTDNTTVKVGDSANQAVRVNVVAGGAAGGTSQADNTALGSGTTAFALYDTTPPAITDGFVGAPRMDSNRFLMITCQSGCGGATTFADASAFTFGTTPVGIFAAVVDDTATNTVAENSAGAPRMNTNRILYSNLRNNAGTEIGTAGAPIRTDPTGSTTQPVSGTVTVTDGAGALNVIVDSSALPTGAATAALQTQPGVDIGDVTVNNAAGASAVNIQDGGNSITVDGTFFQATQPVSIAATVATDPTDEDTRVLGRTKIHDGTDTALVSGTGSLQVTCDNCGAPPTFADNSAFTFGTTGISNVGFVFDDVATNAVTENSAAAARITTNRAVHVNLRNNTGTEISPLTDTQLRATAVPVSGTINVGTFPDNEPVAQGTAAANTAPWPVSSGTVTATTAAWTSATSVDTAISVSTVGMGIVFISYRPTSSPAFTAGMLRFEASDDAGTNYYALTCLRLTTLFPESMFLLSGENATNYIWQCGVGSTTNFRIKLNPAITGVGTANLRLQASATNPETIVTTQPGELPTYIAFRSVAAAAALDGLSIFNAAGSARVVRVMGVYAGFLHTAVVTPVITNFTISRTNTVGTTCTAVTIALMDTINPAVPSTITSNGTCTTDPVVSADLLACTIGPEEGSTGGPTSINGSTVCYDWKPGRAQPITLREGFGLMIKSVATLAPTGTWGLTIVFTISPS